MAGPATDPAGKWLAAMGSAQTIQNYQNGVNNTTKNPMALAAAAEQAYINGVQDAVSSGRRNAALMNTPVSTWKANASGKGAQRLSSGAQAAAAKVQAFWQKWGPIFSQIKQQISAMPRGGMANAMARVQATMTALKQAAGKPIT